MKKTILMGVWLAQMLAMTVLGQSVTTIVTNQPFGLVEPYAVAVDPQDNLYITDSANHRIAKFKPATGELTTYAGRLGESGTVNGVGGAARFFDPRGIVYARGGLVVADSGNHAIRFISLAGGAVTTLAGTPGKSGFQDGPGAGALFRNPRGLAADAVGNIYIADSRNRSVRRLDLNNVVTTVNSSDFLAPAGITIGDNGELYVSDRLDQTIKKIALGGATTLFAGNSGSSGTNDAPSAVQATFNSPEDVLWLGGTFGLLVSDSENQTLRQIRYDTNVTDYVVSTYAGTPGLSGSLDGSLLGSLFKLPSGLVRYSTGFLIVDSENGTIRQILTSPQQPRISDPVIGSIITVVDKDTGKSKTKLLPVTDETFNDTITIGILSERGVRTFYTAGASRTNVFQPDPIADPSGNSSTAPDYQDGLDPASAPPSLTLPLPDLTVKAVSMAEGRTSSRLVQANFHFQVATPSIDSSVAGSVTLRDITTDASIYYTTDGSDPTEGTAGNPASQGPRSSGDKISITLGKTNLTFKARAFRSNFKASQLASVTLSPADFTPNRISFGFAGGEASSDFVASAGQRFYAPVTLTTVPSQTMYGLQFNATVAPGTGPSPVSNAAYQLSFQSMLMELLVDIYRQIPPQEFEQVLTNITTIGSGTNSFTVTNTSLVFKDLLFTNITQNLLGVGWLERKGQGNLYNSGLQDLIKYSIAHDTVFNSANNKIVVGGFSFVVPTNAAVNDTYTIRLNRPSATEDGVSSDVFIEAPDGSDPKVPIKAIQTIKVANRPYIVGDIAPFRWFNAGDFGDTNLLNNDLLQTMQAASYSLNLPPPGSDFEDALDSCCITTNGVDVSSSTAFFDGSDTTINAIGFGDGVKNVSDVFVTFRRALDPSLVWYARYWSNGVRRATVVPNVFRGAGGVTNVPLSRQGIKHAAAPTGEPPSAAFWAESVSVMPGGKAIVPIHANVVGGYPLRVLMLNLKVTPMDGASLPGGALKFVPSAQLGLPTMTGNATLENCSGVWLDDSRTGVSGSAIIGNLEILVPAETPINAGYHVSFEHVSASPNGIAIFPQTVQDGAVTMVGRTLQPFNDGIPDSWRLKYFNSLQNLLSMAGADADGDGLSNLDEYRTGTNPTSSDSQFRLTAATVETAGVKLRWPTAAGQVYILESSPSITAPVWTVLAANVAGTGGVVEYKDDQSDGAVKFYRVRVAP